MMSSSAGFHADQARRNLAKKFNDLLASQLSGDDDVAHAMSRYAALVVFLPLVVVILRQLT
jgi:hypothetical protein